MDYADKVVAITGGTQGIGLAMARAFHQRGARIAIADRQGAEAAAEPFSGLGMTVDVGIEDEVAGFVRETGVRLGPVDVYVSNAGVLMTDEPTWDAAGTDDGQWQTAFDINLMGSVRGARHAWPVMRERGGGVFVIVASAAGLLAQIGAAPYTATKHAAVAFAESLSVAHGDEGLQVVCVCPQAVRTAMLGDSDDGGIAGVDGIVEAHEVAEATLAAIAEKRFLALPHPKVAEYELMRAGQRDRWLGGMRKFRRKMIAERGQPI